MGTGGPLLDTIRTVAGPSHTQDTLVPQNVDHNALPYIMQQTQNYVAV